MELSPGVSYQLARSGQQYGPYEGTQLISMAQSGDVLESDHIWTEGMSDWVPASSIVQLAVPISAEVCQVASTHAAIPITEPIHVKPQRGGEIAGKANPSGFGDQLRRGIGDRLQKSLEEKDKLEGNLKRRKEDWLEDRRKKEEEQERLRKLKEEQRLRDEEAKHRQKLEKEEEARRLKEVRERNEREQREAEERQRQREREEREQIRREEERERELRSRFPGARPEILFGLILLVGVSIASIFFLAELETRSETYSFESVEAFTEFNYEESSKLSVYRIGQGLAVVISILAGLIYVILSTRFLFVAWKYLKDYPEVSTTPGKAAGLMFVPLFNVFWIRNAFVGWQRDFLSTARHFRLETVPSLDRGVFRLPVILIILFFPLLHPFLMLEMGRGTNFLAGFCRDSARDNLDDDEEETGDDKSAEGGGGGRIWRGRRIIERAELEKRRRVIEAELDPVAWKIGSQSVTLNSSRSLSNSASSWACRLASAGSP